MLFDIQSINFTYKRLSKRQFVKIKKQTTNVVWNLAPKALKGSNTLSGLATIVRIGFTPSENGSTLKQKNFFPI